MRWCNVASCLYIQICITFRWCCRANMYFFEYQTHLNKSKTRLRSRKPSFRRCLKHLRCIQENIPCRWPPVSQILEPVFGTWPYQCLRTTPPEKKTHGNISFRNTGEQILPLDCKAKARAKGVFVHRHRYVCFAAEIETRCYLASVKGLLVGVSKPVIKGASQTKHL